VIRCRAAHLDAPFGDLGKSLAEAFGGAIAGTRYAREFADQTEGSIPLSCSGNSVRRAAFTGWRRAESERDLLVAVLLGNRQKPHPGHGNRAASVRMFLDLARATAEPAHQRGAISAPALLGRRRPGRFVATNTGSGADDVAAGGGSSGTRELIIGALNALFVHFALLGTRPSRWTATAFGRRVCRRHRRPPAARTKLAISTARLDGIPFRAAVEAVARRSGRMGGQWCRQPEPAGGRRSCATRTSELRWTLRPMLSSPW